MAVHAQRETFQDDDAIRVHPIITKGGDVVNVVPSDVRLETYVRGKNLDAILDASAKVDRAFKAGGDAVGAATKITNIPGYLPIFQDRNLTEIAARNGRALLGDQGALEAGFMGGSFDVGDLSHLIPVIHPFVTGTKGHLHTAEFCVTDYEAAVVLPAKLMAMCVIDLLADGARGSPAREKGIPAAPDQSAVSGAHAAPDLTGRRQRLGGAKKRCGIRLDRNTEASTMRCDTRGFRSMAVMQLPNHPEPKGGASWQKQPNRPPQAPPGLSPHNW